MIVKYTYLRYNEFVRLDLFLKATKLVKRRAVARQLCEGGRVLVNGYESKPSKVVKRGDVLLVLFASNNLKIEIIDIPFSHKNVDAASLYRVDAETSRTRQDNS